MPTEKGWAVVGPYGLYTGWWMTRRAAIEAHVSGKVLGPGSDPERAVAKGSGSRQPLSLVVPRGRSSYGGRGR